MATDDRKLSNLPVASTINETDVMYLVQNSASKQVLVSTIFGNLSNIVFNGNVSFDSNVQVLSSANAVIDISKTITLLDIPSGTNTISLPKGKVNQLKIISAISSNGIFQISSNILGANIQFSDAGDSGIFLYSNNTWITLSMYYAQGYSI